MNNKKINILVITKSAWVETNALGNTLSNFFSEYKDFRFHNIYFSEELPQNTVCDNYLQITERQLLKRNQNGSQVGVSFSKTEILKLKANNEKNKVIKQEKSVSDIVKKTNSIIFHFLREFIWNTRFRDKSRLDNFLDDAKPDIIFGPAAGPIYLQNIIQYSKKRTGSKVALFFADDVYNYKNFNIFDRIYQCWLRKKLNKSVEISDLLYGASPGLCIEYEQYFLRKIKPLFKGCSLDQFIHKEKKHISLPLKIVYAGNLYYGRDKILANLADEISKINKNGDKINLEIYTTATITSALDKTLNRNTSSQIIGCLPYEQIKNVLAAADIVLHVESFDPKQIKTTRLSFSTKIIDCMQSGSCMMAIGPKDLASIDYLNNIPGPIVITDANKIGETLNNIVKKPNMIISKAKLLNEYAREKHDIKSVRINLQDDFKKIIQEDL